MSQGRKDRPEPSLFVPTELIYNHIPRTHFYEVLGKLLDLEFVRKATRPLVCGKEDTDRGDWMEPAVAGESADEGRQAHGLLPTLLSINAKPTLSGGC